ncbi:unnamed protein product [Protopolystoma xenopodis]|uniref:Uncharacterized protein n=1 Tax=Protopolystoma xenopodis TaxID=117903 RepID=A0A3S5AEL5_9PLAT|nr:unnamed protein product [Protopolystoma xenopodis]
MCDLNLHFCLQLAGFEDRETFIFFLLKSSCDGPRIETEHEDATEENGCRTFQASWHSNQLEFDQTEIKQIKTEEFQL